MTGFSADWLARRAEADDRARAPALVAALAAWAETLAPAGITVADLGGGSGATRRALSPVVPQAHWLILDDDPALLALAEGPRTETRRVDLARHPEAAFEGAPDLIAASAFFDLVSGDWIERFVALLAARGVPLYAALTYDGRESWAPAPAHHLAATAAFHEDMRRDKGFGPALGPAAADCLARALREAGYETFAAPSDWRLARPRDAALMDMLADGTIAAVAGRLPDAEHADWAAGLRAATAAEIGHTDLLAAPPGTFALPVRASA